MNVNKLSCHFTTPMDFCELLKKVHQVTRHELKTPSRTKHVFKCPKCSLYFELPSSLSIHDSKSHQKELIEGETREERKRRLTRERARRFRSRLTPLQIEETREKDRLRIAQRRSIQKAVSLEGRLPLRRPKKLVDRTVINDEEDQCPKCGVLVNRQQFRKHLLSHEKLLHACLVCGRKFANLTGLSLHHRRTHSFRFRNKS